MKTDNFCQKCPNFYPDVIFSDHNPKFGYRAINNICLLKSGNKDIPIRHIFSNYNRYFISVRSDGAIPIWDEMTLYLAYIEEIPEKCIYKFEREMLNE